ncbi:uncharacterized, partial [Tachysurus ichikawai]
MQASSSSSSGGGRNAAAEELFPPILHGILYIPPGQPPSPFTHAGMSAAH